MTGAGNNIIYIMAGGDAESPETPDSPAPAPQVPEQPHPPTPSPEIPGQPGPGLPTPEINPPADPDMPPPYQPVPDPGGPLRM